MRTLPNDVVELLRTPIFAELYRRIDNPAWQPTDEYELVDRFWRHATYDARDMADFQDDATALLRLAATVLSPTGRHPFAPSAAQAAGLDQTARRRLAAAGVLRQSEEGAEFIHDRILNWAIALFLAERLASGTLAADEAASAILDVGRPERLAPGIGSRLGYVLSDFLWLAARSADGFTVAAVISAMLAHPEQRIRAGAFFDEHLVGLGPRILPALRHLSIVEDAGRGPIAGHAAKAIGAIGNRSRGCARRSATPGRTMPSHRPHDGGSVSKRQGLRSSEIYS